MASYSTDTGSLDLTPVEMRTLRASVSNGHTEPALLASLRAARIIDAENRVHKSLRAFADELATTTVEWSIVCIEPEASYCYRILVSDHSIIGHCEPLDAGATDTAALATPVLFTHHGRLGVVILQILAIPPRARAVPTTGNGRTVTWETLVRAVGADTSFSPWPGDGVRRVWSLASSRSELREPMFGVETDSERLAIGQRIGNGEVLLVGATPEAVFRQLSVAF